MKLLTRSKVIYDVHEDYAKVISAEKAPRLLQKPVWMALRMLESFITQFLSGVIVATDEIVEFYD